MGRLLAGLAPELSLLVSERKDRVVSSSARWEGRPTSATQQPTQAKRTRVERTEAPATPYGSLRRVTASPVCAISCGRPRPRLEALTVLPGWPHGNWREAGQGILGHPFPTMPPGLGPYPVPQVLTVPHLTSNTPGKLSPNPQMR